MAELLQSGQGGGDRAAANSLSALLKKSRKTAELPTADQVEFWRSPEKTGWMHSQGEHIKTWRKRWFVLKQGFLFRFSSLDVNSTTKPRGIVDLSQVTDVTDGTAATGRSNSIKLSTATGSRCYLTESETSQVEWISALESSVERIVKIVAGVDEEEHTPGNAVSKALAAQFKSYSGKSTGAGSSGSGRPHRSSHYHPGTNENGNQMLNVVNYGGYSGSGGGGGGDDVGGSFAPSAPPHHHSQAPSGDYGYVNIDYGGMSGGGFQIAPPEIGGGGGGGYGTGSGGGGAGGPPQASGMYGNVYTPAAANPPYSQMQQQQGGGMEYSTGYGASGYAAAIAGPPPLANTTSYQEHHHHQHQHYQPPQQPQQQQYVPPQEQQHQQYQYQPQQQPHQQQQQHGSTLLDAVTAPANPPPPNQAAVSPWQVHYTADNRPYYFNVETQITQWEAPPGA